MKARAQERRRRQPLPWRSVRRTGSYCRVADGPLGEYRIDYDAASGTYWVHCSGVAGEFYVGEGRTLRDAEEVAEMHAAEEG